MEWDWFSYSIKNKKRWWSETFPGGVSSPRVPLQSTQRHKPCSGVLWGGQGSSGGRGEARASSSGACAGQTPGLVTLPAHYPFLLSLLLHKKRERSRDVIQGHRKSSERNLEEPWGWLSLSSWHAAGITTNSEAIASKELQDILEPSSRPGLPLTEVRAMFPTCDTSHNHSW